MPTGKVKFFDAARGFGFIGGDDGVEVFLRASALPAGVATLRAGTRVEYGMVEGRRGPQALSLQVLEEPSLAKVRRRKPQEMVPVVEDLIKLLDRSSDELRRGRYPENSKKIAKVLQAVAKDFNA